MITGSLAVIKGGKDGAAIIGYDVEQGRVAYITKENPADFRMKLAVNCYVHHIDRDLLNKNLLVLDGRRDSPAAICALTALSEGDLRQDLDLEVAD